MELKPGYKQTEVGVIPEDWDCTTVNGIASSVRNAIVGGPFGSDLVSTDYVEDGVPVIRGQNMGRQWLSGDFVFVTHAKANSLESNLARPNDLIFTQRGTLGQVSLVPTQPFNRYLVSQSQMKLTVNRKSASPIFFYYVFISPELQACIRQNTIQTGVPHINLGILKILSVSCPPLLEQQAIAEALSDTDALIESLEQLIAKKRDIKQGAMEELLTGKRRLPVSVSMKNGRKRTGVGEIPEDWICTTIDTIGLVVSGKRLPLGSTLAKQQTPYPYIRVADMRPGTVSLSDIQFVPEDIYPFIKNYRIYRDDIFISVAGTLGIVGKIPEELDGANLTENANKITNISCSRDYLLYVLMSAPIQNVIKSLQTVGAQPKLALTRIRKFFIPLPPTKAEQTAIAEILSEMDAEIAALEGKLAKARAIKEGMMGELLTGKTRLV